MKNTTLILGIALFIMGTMVMSGCGDAAQNNTTEEHEEGGEHEEGEEHEEGDEHEDHGGGHDESGEHSHASGGHMDHMNDVRDWLKTELGDKYDTPVPPATDEQLVMGKKTFTTICAACHGAGGKGDGAAAAALPTKPADFTDPAHSKFYSDQGRIHIIKNGIKESSMVGWSSALGESEILAVYAYVRSLRSEDEDGDHEHGEGAYTCSMHPEVSGNKGDKCPKCGMDLLTLKKHEHEDEGHNHEGDDDDGDDDDGHDH